VEALRTRGPLLPPPPPPTLPEDFSRGEVGDWQFFGVPLGDFGGTMGGLRKPEKNSTFKYEAVNSSRSCRLSYTRYLVFIMIIDFKKTEFLSLVG